MQANIEDEDILYNLAYECEGLFAQLQETFQKTQSEHPTIELWAEFQQRFAIWAAHIGVFARKSQCLDTRLRNHPDLQDLVARLLDILRRSLQQCTIETCNQGEREAIQTATLTTIDDTLTRLNRLGVTIRQSGRGKFDSRAKKFAAGLDLSSFTSLCASAVHVLYPGAHQSLKDYLSKSMTDRYAKMLFLDSRHNKLKTRRELRIGLPPIHEVPNDETQTRTDITKLSMTVKNPLIRISRPFAPSQSDLSSVNMHRIRNRLRPPDEASTRYNKTSSIQVNQGNYPRPPVTNQGGNIVTCQWCSEPLSEQPLSESAWRRHVDRDLKPYVCLSEECPEAHPTYPTFDEWFRHMELHGWRWHQQVYLTSSWACTICEFNRDVYSNPQALYSHLEDFHISDFPNTQQLQAISRQSKTEQLRASNDCLLCCFAVEEQGYNDEAIFPKRRKGQPKQEASKSARKSLEMTNPDPHSSDPEVSDTSSDSDDMNSHQQRRQRNKDRSKTVARHVAMHLQVLMLLTLRFAAILQDDDGDLDDGAKSDSVDIDEGNSASVDADLGRLSHIASEADIAMKDRQEGNEAENAEDIEDLNNDDIVEDDVPIPDTDFDLRFFPRQYDDLAAKNDEFLNKVIESGAYQSWRSGPSPMELDSVVTPPPPDVDAVQEIVDRVPMELDKEDEPPLKPLDSPYESDSHISSSFEIDEPAPVPLEESREDDHERVAPPEHEGTIPRPRLSKIRQWGKMAALMAAGTAEPTTELDRDTGLQSPDLPADDNVNNASPTLGLSPASLKLEGMPWSHADDLKFAATVAANLKESGFDPNIVIDDPAFRRQDSRPGTELRGNSCTECRRRKQKCDQRQPCSNCFRRFPLPKCEYYIKRGNKSPKQEQITGADANNVEPMTAVVADLSDDVDDKMDDEIYPDDVNKSTAVHRAADAPLSKPRGPSYERSPADIHDNEDKDEYNPLSISDTLFENKGPENLKTAPDIHDNDEEEDKYKPSSIEPSMLSAIPESSRPNILLEDRVAESLGPASDMHEGDDDDDDDEYEPERLFDDKLLERIKKDATAISMASKEKGSLADDMDIDQTDEVRLYGGIAENGRPAELVRIKKDGTAISIATGKVINLGKSKRSLSKERQEEEEIMRQMARRKKNASPEELAPKKCREPGCTKEFKRPCDLTKHEKTHSRPWKCPIPTCKYHDYGWPTEKEMDRHINDKHSDAPAMFECLFKPCPYKSKRESNCKQHMEKAHGWNYVRTKLQKVLRPAYDMHNFHDNDEEYKPPAIPGTGFENKAPENSGPASDTHEDDDDDDEYEPSKLFDDKLAYDYGDNDEAYEPPAIPGTPVENKAPDHLERTSVDVEDERLSSFESVPNYQAQPPMERRNSLDPELESIEDVWEENSYEAPGVISITTPKEAEEDKDNESAAENRINLRREVLGEKHPDTIWSIANLATIYYDQGRLNEAEALMVQVLDLRREVLGEKHPDTIRSIANLASTYYTQGRYSEAEALEVQVLNFRREIIGEKHPDTIWSIANLATTYYDQGRLNEAEALMVQVLDLRREVFGEKHPDTIRSMASLASTYHAQGRLNEAEALRVQVLNLRREILGKEQPDTLSAMHILAHTWEMQGRHHDALALMEECVQSRRSVLGPEHPLTAKTIEILKRWKSEDETLGPNRVDEKSEPSRDDLDQAAAPTLSTEY